MVWLSDLSATLQEFMELGGDVLWAIMLVLLLMWTFILERMWYFKMVHPKRVREIIAAWDARVDTTSWHARQIREAMISEASGDLSRHLLMIKTLIALCPLLGLLGTVTGMLNVFDIMAITGTGNARAMASGVSKATVPTMAGMVAALSGVYFGSRFEYWHSTETEKLEDYLQHH
ncbi:MAG: MotA/TolQ/ExbB proton channel family protein [Xanthomonadales bacterium]|nr:MotA/TolQ/ExbB proton channel family protein [Xanthomonadales bacterium]